MTSPNQITGKWTFVDVEVPPARQWLALACIEEPYEPGIIHRFWGDEDMEWCIREWGIRFWLPIPGPPTVDPDRD